MYTFKCTQDLGYQIVCVIVAKLVSYNEQK